MIVPLVEEALEEGLIVFINPDSEFTHQTEGSDYGVIVRYPNGDLIDGRWAQVQWKNKEGETVYENAYRIYTAEDLEFDLLYEIEDEDPQLQFEF